MDAPVSLDTSFLVVCGFCRTLVPAATVDHVDVGEASVPVCAGCTERTRNAEWLPCEIGWEPAENISEDRPLAHRGVAA